MVQSNLMNQLFYVGWQLSTRVKQNDLVIICRYLLFALAWSLETSQWPVPRGRLYRTTPLLLLQSIFVRPSRSGRVPRCRCLLLIDVYQYLPNMFSCIMLMSFTVHRLQQALVQIYFVWIHLLLADFNMHRYYLCRYVLKCKELCGRLMGGISVQFHICLTFFWQCPLIFKTFPKTIQADSHPVCATTFCYEFS